MDTITLIQGDESSPLTPLILIHAISGLALPYFALGPLSEPDDDRPIYGISSPMVSVSNYPSSTSFSKLAAVYVSMVRHEIQPHGPYLLGGWSMGGMIAIEMANLLQSKGEEVRHVIMVDSMNPQYYPAFQSQKEHDLQAAITYNAIARRVNAPEIELHRLQMDGYHRSDDSAESSEGETDELDEASSLAEMLSGTRRHVHQGLAMMSNAGSAAEKIRLQTTDVTLIKCSTLGRLSTAMSDYRKLFSKKMFLEPTLAWPPDAFQSFQTLRYDASHDGCFDAQNVAQLTGLMKGVLDRLAY